MLCFMFDLYCICMKKEQTTNNDAYTYNPHAVNSDFKTFRTFREKNDYVFFMLLFALGSSFPSWHTY